MLVRYCCWVIAASFWRQVVTVRPSCHADLPAWCCCFCQCGHNMLSNGLAWMDGLLQCFVPIRCFDTACCEPLTAYACHAGLHPPPSLVHISLILIMLQLSMFAWSKLLLSLPSIACPTTCVCVVHNIQQSAYH